MKLSNEKLYQKYKPLFNFAQKKLYNLLKYPIKNYSDGIFERKLLDNFKEISMDYNDIKQEVFIELLNTLKIYDEKYKDIEKIHIYHHIKKLVSYIVFNLLRNNNYKVFKSIETYLLSNVDEEENMFNILPKLNGIVITPNLIPTTKHEESLKSNDAEIILNKCYKDELFNEIDYNIIKMKIIDNYTFDEISKIVNIGSRQAVQKRFKKGISKMKIKFKTKSQLFKSL